MRQSTAPDSKRTPSWVVWLSAALLFALSSAMRAAMLDRPLMFDELYHILAARSWLADGSFAVLDGEYGRSQAYTVLVSWFFAAFGESPGVARLPAILAGSASVALCFLFVWRTVSTPAAWFCALLFAVDPLSIFQAQLCRMYGLNMLCFLVAAIGVFQLAKPRIGSGERVRQAALAIAAMTLALALQRTGVIALLLLALWLLLEHGRALLSGLRRGQPWYWVGLGVAVIAGVSVLLLPGFVAGLWRQFHHSPMWIESFQDDSGYYLKWYRWNYPQLIELLPVAAFLAWRRSARLALFSAFIFGGAFVIHSYAGSKAPRYLSYAHPFLFVIWGLGLDQLRLWIAAGAGWCIERASIRPVIGRRVAGCTALALALLALVLAFPAGLGSVRAGLWHLRRAHALPYGWAMIAPEMRRLAAEVEVVMTTANNQAIYHLGDYDFAVTPTQVFETDSGEEFGRDPKSGRFIIGSAESVERVVTGTRSGLFISSAARFGEPSVGISDEAIAVLREHAVLVPTPERAEMVVYRWENEELPEGYRAEGLPRR